MISLFVSFGVSGPGGLGLCQAVLTVPAAPQSAAAVAAIREYLQASTPPGMTAAIISWQVLGPAESS